jgi:hypothetical protein
MHAWDWLSLTLSHDQQQLHHHLSSPAVPPPPALHTADLWVSLPSPHYCCRPPLLHAMCHHQSVGNPPIKLPPINFKCVVGVRLASLMLLTSNCQHTARGWHSGSLRIRQRGPCHVRCHCCCICHRHSIAIAFAVTSANAVTITVTITAATAHITAAIVAATATFGTTAVVVNIVALNATITTALDLASSVIANVALTAIVANATTLTTVITATFALASTILAVIINAVALIAAIAFQHCLGHHCIGRRRNHCHRYPHHHAKN